jgi:hypothetical protein
MFSALFIIAHEPFDLTLDDIVRQLLGCFVFDATNVGHGETIPAIDPAEELAVKFGEETALAL